MNKYRVALWENPDDLHTIIFECMADNFDHADEQARNAYPDCQICTIELMEDTDG